MEDKQISNKSTETGGNTVSKVDWNYPVPQYLMKLQTKVDAPEHLINEVYGKWADTFEQDSINSGYTSHIHCSQIFNATALKYHNEKAKSIRIIDVGAGTGVVGGLLKGLGYANVDGIDCCDVMLQKARDRKIYKNTFVNFVDERRFESIEDGMYDALISSGSISPPLIQARAFNEMIRWVKKGGFLCFTLREDAHDEERFGYTEQIKKLEEENKWKLISKEKVDYCKREGSENVFASKAYICVYEIL